MKRKYTLFFIMAIFYSYSNAQRLRPFEIAKIVNFEPIWSTVVKDSILGMNIQHTSIDEYNGINGYGPESDYVIHDPYILHAKYFGGGFELGGSILECRDLESGKLIWQKRYGRFEDDIQTAIRSFFIDSIGNLKVIGQKKRHPIGHPDTNPDKYRDMVVFSEILDIKTGIVIHSSDCNDNEIDHFPTKFEKLKTANHSKILLNGDEFLYYDFIIEDGKKKIRKVNLDKCGMIDSDIKSAEIRGNFESFNLEEIGNDTLMTVTVEKSDSGEGVHFIFWYFDREINIMDTLKSPVINFNPIFTKLAAISKGKNKVLLTWQENVSSFPRPNRIAVFDVKANLLKSVLYDSIYPNLYSVFDWETENDKITLVHGRTELTTTTAIQNYLQVTEFSDNTGNPVALVSYRMEDSLKIFAPLAIKEVNTNQLLLALHQQEYFIRSNGRPASDSYATAIVLMLVNKDKFTKPVSSEDVVVEDEFAPIVFPNPGSDALHISLHQSFTGQVQVADMQGKMVCTHDLKNADRKDLDTCTWPSGMYVIQIFDDTRQVVYRYKWVKN